MCHDSINRTLQRQKLLMWFVWISQHRLQRIKWQLETQPLGLSNFDCCTIFLNLVLRFDESDLGNRTRFTSGLSRGLQLE